eukprot:242984-Prorocentrum_minimum.AAC.1
MGATVAPLPPEVVVEDAGKAASGSDGLPKPVHVDARMSIEEMVPKLTGLPSLTRPEVPVATLFSGEILGVTTKLVQAEQQKKYLEEDHPDDAPFKTMVKYESAEA